MLLVIMEKQNTEAILNFGITCSISTVHLIIEKYLMASVDVIKAANSINDFVENTKKTILQNKYEYLAANGFSNEIIELCRKNNSPFGVPESKAKKLRGSIITSGMICDCRAKKGLFTENFEIEHFMDKLKNSLNKSFEHHDDKKNEGELEIIKQFREYNGNKLTANNMMWINPSYCHIACTSDALVKFEGKVVYCVEIKCSDKNYANDISDDPKGGLIFVSEGKYMVRPGHKTGNDGMRARTGTTFCRQYFSQHATTAYA